MADFYSIDAMLERLRSEMRGTTKQAISAMGRSIPRSLAPRTGIAPARRPVKPEMAQAPKKGEMPSIYYESERATDGGIRPFRGQVRVSWRKIDAERGGMRKRRKGDTVKIIERLARPRLRALARTPRRGLAQRVWRILSSSRTRNFSAFGRVVGQKKERHRATESQVTIANLLYYAERATPSNVTAAAIRAAHNAEMKKAQLRLAKAEK